MQNYPLTQYDTLITIADMKFSENLHEFCCLGFWSTNVCK